MCFLLIKSMNSSLIIDNSATNKASMEALLVAGELLKRKKDFLILNLLSSFKEGSISLVQKESTFKFYIKGREINITDCIFLNPFRPELLLLSINSKYPHLDVHKLQQLYLDMIFYFKRLKVRFIPGNIESILEGDSKTTLLYLANQVGLRVPNYTADIHFSKLSLIAKDGAFYKKNLGHPFVITLDEHKKKLKALTVTNSLEFPHLIDKEDLSYWQVQAPIRAVSQVRAFVMDNGFNTAVSADIEVPYSDFRQVRQIEGREFKWIKKDLPNDTLTKIVSLLKLLNLKYATPEFLLDENGDLIFIDLNPAGDWAGFFDKKTNLIISKTICDILTSRPA